MGDAHTWTLRFGWLLVAGGLLVHRDMCLGGGNPPPPVDSGPVDSSSDTGKDARNRAPRPVERGAALAAPHGREKV